MRQPDPKSRFWTRTHCTICTCTFNSQRIVACTHFRPMTTRSPRRESIWVEHTKEASGQHLRKGLAAVEILAHPDIRVEYSSISELELMNGRARGKAIENAAKEGVPDRIWNRLDGYEIRARLTTADLANIRTRVEGLGPILNKAGILATVSDVYRTRDVLDLAKGIIGLVYMGFVDGVIYSSALIAGVDYMITEDTFFRKTINLIRNGPEPYDQARQQIKILVGQITLDDVADVTLPVARKASIK